MYIRNSWYAVAWGSEVGRDILARTICNEPIVLFRQEDGAPAALEDRCCHRHLPLSQGKLIGDVVQCGYHGLQFNRNGACVEVPGQTAIPPGAGVRAFPVEERYGFVWAWFGEPALADPASIPAIERLEDPAWTGITGNILHLECDYQLLNDNLIDLGHETFVHASTIGHEVVAGTPIKTTRDGDFVRAERWMLDHDPAPFWKGAIASIGYEGNVDRWQQIRFQPPCSYVLHVGVAPAGSGAPEGDKSKGVECCVISMNTPETDKSCWQFWTFYRNFNIDDAALDEKTNDTIHDILSEDIVVLDAQQKSLDANPDAEYIDINHDAGGLQARRLISERLEHEGASVSPQAAE